MKAFTFYSDSFITKRSFASNIEILIKLCRFGLKASEVPLNYRYDLRKSESRIKILKTILKYIFLCFQNVGKDKKIFK